MKAKSIFLLAGFLLSLPAVRAQKALPIQVDDFLASVYNLQSCEGSYHLCRTQTDDNGLVSVKDAGRLEDQLNKLEEDMKELGMSQMSSATSSPTQSMPSQEQMAQMQRNAMNMQNMTPEQAMKMAQSMGHQPTAMASNNSASLDEIGQAETAQQELGVTSGEVVQKILELESESQTKISDVQRRGPCQLFKVPNADLALPKCGCVKARDLDYYNRRIQFENDYLMKLNSLLQSYLPVFKAKIGVIDKVESDFKYGDGTGIPAVKSQLAGMQMLALNRASSVLGKIVDAVKESGNEYANVVNVNNGHLSEACQ